MINQKTLQSLKDIMQDDYPEILQRFLDESLTLYSEIHETFEHQDYDKLRFIAGIFSETCYSVGADRLAVLSSAIERKCLEGLYQGIQENIDDIDQIYEPVRAELKLEKDRLSRLAS